MTSAADAPAWAQDSWSYKSDRFAHGIGSLFSEFVNEPPVPGLMFGWGPAGSGTIAFTNRDGGCFTSIGIGTSRRCPARRTRPCPRGRPTAREGPFHGGRRQPA